MIEWKPSYRVRIENALIHSGACAIETTIHASTRRELVDGIDAFMNAHGFASNDLEISRPDVVDHPLLGVIVLREPAIYLVGKHWRTEEITRVEDDHNRARPHVDAITDPR